MGVDILEHELLEGMLVFHNDGSWHEVVHTISSEETKKRAQEDSTSYQAVGFVYKETPEAKSISTLPQPEHPPTSAVDVVQSEEDRFVVIKGLAVPGHIRKVNHPTCRVIW